mgnify:CR=1 FL=1
MLKKITVKKLYNNYASIRSYIVDEIARRGEDLLIIHDGSYMLVKNNVLKSPEKFQIHKTNFKSKIYKNQSYQLYDFYFVKDQSIQNKLF